MLQYFYLLYFILCLQEDKKRRKDLGEPRFRETPTIHIKRKLPVGPSTTRQGKNPCRNKCPKCAKAGKTKCCTAGTKGHTGDCAHGIMGGSEHVWKAEESAT